MLKVPRVESDHIFIGPYGKEKSNYLGVKTMENVGKISGSHVERSQG